MCSDVLMEQVTFGQCIHQPVGIAVNEQFSALPQRKAPPRRMTSIWAMEPLTT